MGEVVSPRCCGVDGHKKTVVAGLIVPGPQGQPVKEVRTYGTMTDELLALVDWVVTAGWPHVALERTGRFWKPLYNLLEGVLEVFGGHCRAPQGGAGAEDRCPRR
jgi:hypothetical protein